MKEKDKILFIVPDGVGIKNYLYSNIIQGLKTNFQLFFWTTLPKKAFHEVEKLHDITVNYSKFTFPKEPLPTRFFRESATYARLLFNSRKLNNPTIVQNWSKQSKGLKNKLYYKLVEILGLMVSKKYSRILILEKKSFQFTNKKAVASFRSQLEVLKPKTIFITHQRVAHLNPICIAAKRLNIKVVTCIYSWDNISKASLAIRADSYCVWSDYMKEEFKKLYPEIDVNSIEVTGTPQFEFYFDDSLKMSRQKFANLYGLDLNKKWICFSGDDEKTSPYDPNYLADVSEAILNIAEKKRPIIIFRRCPVDVSNRFDDVVQKYSRVINVIDPCWTSKTNHWGAVYPKVEDVNLLVNIVLHCEFVINVGSTMAHDFAVYNKPCFYLNYNQPKTLGWSIENIYRYQHFRSMNDFNAVGWFNNKEEIKDKIVNVLFNENEIAIDRLKWLNRIVKSPLNRNSNNIVKHLIND